MPTQLQLRAAAFWITLPVLWCSAGWLAWRPEDVPAHPAALREFQQMTGGFGPGAVLRPTWCFHSVDARVQAHCPTQLRPVPGLIPYCPHETMGLKSGELPRP